MAHAKGGAVEHQGRAGGAHAFGFGTLAHGIGDRSIGVVGSGTQQREHVIVAWVAVQILQGRDQQL